MRGWIAISLAIALGCGRIAFEPVTTGSDDAGNCVRSCIATPPQSGCCPGDACQIVSAEPTCVRPGTRRISEPCTDEERCEAGLTCDTPYLPSDPRGTCVRLCDVDADCVVAGAVCFALPDKMGGILPAAGGCSTDCADPRGGTGCGSERTCRFILLLHRDATTRYATFCDIPGTMGQNGVCTGNLDCLPGFGCAQSRCRQVCRVGMTDCAGACSALVPAGIVFGAEYGFCV